MTRDQKQQIAALKAIVNDLCARPDEQDVISHREWRMVVRKTWIDGTPAVIKLWARPDLKGVLRRRLGISSARYEWKNLQRMHDLGIPVPKPIMFSNLSRNPGDFTEALVMEELVGCKIANGYLKGLIAAGDEDGVLAFETRLIEITAAMVKAGIIDYDHAMVNTVVVPSSDVYRLDVEHARKVRSLSKSKKLYARMLGQLLGSYTFVTQPDTDRSRGFAARLLEAVQPPADVLPLVQAHMNKMFALQSKHRGIDISVTLPEFDRL